MDQSLSSLCQERVPRYTSYPTAPHFGPDVGPQDYADWLADLDTAQPVSLYMHVPFCTALCHYCGCHTKVVNKPDVIASYGALLEAELGLVGDHIGRRQAVSHIHWGGGTPSLMPAGAFAAIVEAMQRHFTFAESLEHAIELDPRTVDSDLAKRLAAAGVNRASFGVQEFSQRVQTHIGRRQPFGVVVKAMTALRNVGIDAINFDLMYGLPAQTLHDVKRTAALTVELAPARIALFGYAHVPWFRKNQQLIDETLLPDAEARFDQAEQAASVLTGAGYVRIGIDHFARPDDPLTIAAGSGEMARNFQGYTTDAAPALMGLGASSIGRLPGGYIQNAPDMITYRKRIEGGELATVRGKTLCDEDRVRGAVIERLMCDFGVDLDRMAIDLDCPRRFLRPTESRLSSLRDKGLLDYDGHILKMTHKGRPFVRLAAAAFDAYLEDGAARHSEAV